MRKAVVEALIILVISAVFGIARNYLFAYGISILPSDEAIIDVGAKNIDLQEAKRLFDQGVIFLDSRPCAYYIAGHIAGARCLSLDEYEAKKDEVLADVGKDDPIVTYCDGQQCSSSLLLAEKLVNDGYTNVYVFAGGWPEWVEAGYPTEKGLGGGGGW